MAAGMTKGSSVDDIKGYLQKCDRGNIENINGRHSVVLHAAKRNDTNIMELILQYGADPQAKDPSNIPLLAALIMWTKWTYKNADKMVALLLSYGADPHCVPEQMWSIYIMMPRVIQRTLLSILRLSGSRSNTMSLLWRRRTSLYVTT